MLLACDGLLSLMVGMMLVQSDSELEEDEILNEEIAELIEDANNPPASGVRSDEAPGENSHVEESDEEEDLVENCDVAEDEESMAPSLVSKPKPRLQRNVRQPERYNPSTGKSYNAKLERVHNIITQGRPNLQYEEYEINVEFI